MFWCHFALVWLCCSLGHPTIVEDLILYCSYFSSFSPSTFGAYQTELNQILLHDAKLATFAKFGGDFENWGIQKLPIFDRFSTTLPLTDAFAMKHDVGGRKMALQTADDLKILIT